MGRSSELAGIDQFTLQALFEITAGCGLVFAALPFADSLLFTFVFAVLTVWSVRVSNWTVRLPLMVWLGGCCVLCLGLACLERAFAAVVTTSSAATLEQLAFFGTLTAIVGATVGLTGLCVLLLVLACARRHT